jgi:hypothetical protein
MRVLNYWHSLPLTHIGFYKIETRFLGESKEESKGIVIAFPTTKRILNWTYHSTLCHSEEDDSVMPFHIGFDALIQRVEGMSKNK